MIIMHHVRFLLRYFFLIVLLNLILGVSTVFGQVSTLQAWAMVYHGTATTAQSIAYTVPTGSNARRVLVVAIATSRTNVGLRTVVLTYGGQTLTSVAGDIATTSVRQHTQLYYLNEAGLDAATNTTLSVTVSGGTTNITDVFAAVFDDVNQSSPITNSRNYSGGTTTRTTFAFATALTVNANDQAVEIISCLRTGSTTLRTIAYATNWTMAAQQTYQITVAVRNAVANRSIPATNTTDVSSTTFSGTALASMTGMSLKAAPTPSFSGLTASPGICVGAATVTLSGTVSATGPVYPANGETVGVTINGSTQNATISGGAGGFSINFTSAAIPSSGIPYTITYSYAGNGNLKAAANNTSTALTVNPYLPVSISVAPSANPVCSGNSVIFTATPTNGGTTPAYQWKVNGINAGTNSATYSYSPANSDAVTCVLTSNAVCVTGSPATSNTVTMTVNPGISNNTISTAQSICPGATPSGLTGTLPTGASGSYVYLWESSTTSAVAGFATASGISNTQNYTSGSLSQTTWFRRTVTSDDCSNISTAIQITVYPLPTATYTLSASPASITYGSTSILSLSGSQSGVNYQLRTGLITIGSAVAGTGSAISFASVSPISTTTYNVLATNTTTGCSVQQTSTTTVTVTGAPVNVSFMTSSQKSLKESGTITVTVILSASYAGTVTVPFTVNGSSTATGGGTDYTITGSPISITTGNTTGVISITIADDILDESDETVIIDMGTPTNAIQGLITTHTATITDDDPYPTGSIAVNRGGVSTDPTSLVNNVLLKGCLSASNVVFTGAAFQIGHFTSGSSSFPISEGIILSTGNVADDEGPNKNYNTTEAGFTQNTAVLEFDFVPAGNLLEFSYVFASEEYAEFINEASNDNFTFLLSGPGLAETNVALIPSTSTPVAINSVHSDGYVLVNNYPTLLRDALTYPTTFGHTFTQVNDDATGFFGTAPSRYYYRISPTVDGAEPPLNASYYVDNGHFADRVDIDPTTGRRKVEWINGNGSSEMEFDGRTVKLTASHAVTACQTYHIKFIVNDVSDNKWDSGVFLEGKSFTSNEVEVSSQIDGISGDANNMYEGCEGSFIRFQRSAGADNSQPFTFPIILAGTATNGVDFVYTTSLGVIIGDGTFPTSATIPAFQNYIDYYYKAQSDGVIEGNETVIFRVNNSCPCAVVQTYFEKTVTIIDVPQIQTSSVSVIQCTVANPVATITVNMQNGLDPNNYEFSLDGGTFQLSNVFTITSTQPDGSDIVGTTHYVTVKDKLSCNSITESNILIPAIAPFLANAGSDIAMCEGQTGVQLNASGGIYYSWTSSPANGITYLSSTTIANPTVSNTIPAATYTFTVTAQDVPGASPVCQGHDDMVLTVNLKPGVIVTAADYTVCNAIAVQLNAAVTNGGASPTYLWNPTTDLSSSTIYNPIYTPVVSSFQSQFFNVTVTGSNGCSTTASSSAIEVFPSPVITTGTIVNASCGGSNGSATVSASSPGTSPVPTFTYLWDAAAGNQVTATATNLAAGTYLVTVTDVEHGCINTKQVSVGSTGDITPPTAVCQNISITLDGTGNATITPADINNGSTDNCTSPGNLVLTLDKSTFNTSNVGVNTVILTVKDQANNTSTCSATVTVNYSATCNISGSQTIYQEHFGTGTINGGYTTPGGSAYAVVGSVMRVTTNINTANFFLSRSINISSFTNLNISVAITAQNALDAGADYIQLWYSVDAGPFVQFANNGYMTGTWIGTSCTNVPNGTSLQIKILSYQNGATEWREFDDVHLTGNPAMEATANITNVTCNGGNNGAINVTVIGGATPYTYFWTTSNGSGLVPSAEDQNGLTAGTYNLVVTDANSVVSTNFAFTVTQPAVDPAISTGLAVSDASVCNPAGGNVIFTITTSQSGIHYELKTTGGASLSPAVTGTGTGSNLNLTILQANVPTSTITYKVVATSASGCTTADLTDQPTLTVTSTSPPTGSASQSFCSNTAPKVSDLSVTGTGIIWYNAASGGSVVAPTTNLVNGATYYASQTGGGCESPTRLAVTATVNTTPTIINVTHGNICGSGTVVIHATASIGTVNWHSAQTGGSLLGTGNDFTTPNISTTTSYWVDATNSGCTTSTRSEVIATVYALPTITLGTNPSVCIGAVTAGLTYSATTGGANQYSINFDLTAEGAGFVDVTNAVLPVSPISITIPVTATPGTYNAILTVRNSANSCGSINYPISVTIIPLGSWLGGTSTDWNTASNWSCSFIPLLTTNVLISNVANKPIINTGNTGTTKNILIESGSSLTVVGTIQIAGTISNSGTFTATAGTVEMKGSNAQSIGANVFAGNTIMNLTINNSAGVTLQSPLSVTGIVKATAGDLSSGGNLTLVSNASQTALIDGSGAGFVTGGVTMQRYLSSGLGYKYFSSPFSDADVAAFSSYLSTNATIPKFYAYDEDNHRDSSNSVAYMSGWVNYAGTLSPMYGYAANLGDVSSAKTVSITGTVNNGSKSVTLYNHNRKYTKGFNLVGNPYPSPIDWGAASGWTKTNIDGAIYFFNASGTQYTGAYSSSVNGIGSGIIPSMQGFFVHVTNGSYPVTATLSMNNNVRVNNDLSSGFSKSGYSGDIRPIISLTAGYADEKNPIDPVVVYFDEKATIEFNSKLDALKLMNTDVKIPNFYALSADANQLSIRAIPYPDSMSVVPLGLKTDQAGWISFRATGIENMPPGLQIYFSDNKTGIYTDLLQSTGCRLNMIAGTDEKRFSLIFSKRILFDTQDSNDAFLVYSSGGKLIVSFTGTEGEKGDMVINNMIGQELWRKQIIGTGIHEFDPQLKTGVYIVSFYSGKDIYSKKVLITNQ